MTDLFIDLLLTNDDLTLVNGIPQLCANRDSIAQDIKTCVRASGLLTALIGERSRDLRDAALLQLELLIEQDERLIAGTVSIIEKSGVIEINANTILGDIYFTVTL